MQPIATSIAPLPAPAAADSRDSSPEVADGFTALLAGLVPPPVMPLPGHSGKQPLVLGAGSGTTNEPGGNDLAAPTTGAAAPDTAPAPTVPPAAGASSIAANAQGAAMPGSFGAPIDASAKAGNPATPPIDAAEGAGAAGIGKAQAVGDVAMAPVVARPDARPADPRPMATPAATAAAAPQPDQRASGNRPSPAIAVAQANETIVQTPGAIAIATTPRLAMTVAPDTFGRGEWQPTFSSEPADGSLLPGLAAPAAAGGDAASASPTAAAPASAAMQPVRQLAAVIDRAVAGEVRQLTIQLSPRELGAIDIALSFDEKRRLSVSILAERPETLELLKSDARQLERLLGRQGLELADAGLELGLMSQERRGDGNAHESASQHVLAAFGERTGADEPQAQDPSDTLPAAAHATLGGARRLNLSI